MSGIFSLLSPAQSSCPHRTLLSELLPQPLAAVKSSLLKPLFFIPKGKHGLTFLHAFWEILALVQLRRTLWCIGRAPQRDGDPHSVQLGFLPLYIYFPDCNILLWPKRIGYFRQKSLFIFIVMFYIRGNNYGLIMVVSLPLIFYAS